MMEYKRAIPLGRIRVVEGFDYPCVGPIPNAIPAVVLPAWISDEATSEDTSALLESNHDGVNLSCIGVCVLRTEIGIRLVSWGEGLLPVRVGRAALLIEMLIEAAEGKIGGVGPRTVSRVASSRRRVPGA
jgi:hypothetical protein